MAVDFVAFAAVVVALAPVAAFGLPARLRVVPAPDARLDFFASLALVAGDACLGTRTAAAPVSTGLLAAGSVDQVTQAVAAAEVLEQFGWELVSSPSSPAAGWSTPSCAAGD
ncbi:hypothetical protein [Micromonospora sp. 4G51]|uniref:hypothetical protein n=1 Tax=Micromonospora sicca TaxID=2202420 RepID=UPI001F2B727E|nr:hypothetical protein [Micromonospora sp. 4G51]